MSDADQLPENKLASENKKVPFEELPPDVTPEPEGFGGWLIVPMLGLISTPFIRGNTILSTFEIFGQPHFDLIDANYPGFNNLLYIELFLTTSLFAYTIFVLVVFFKKKAITPNLMVVLYLVASLFTVGDSIATHFVFHEEFDFSTTGDYKLVIGGVFLLFCLGSLLP